MDTVKAVDQYKLEWQNESGSADLAFSLDVAKEEGSRIVKAVEQCELGWFSSNPDQQVNNIKSDRPDVRKEWESQIAKSRCKQQQPDINLGIPRDTYCTMIAK